MRKYKISPYIKILLTFIGIILLGSILLTLPISSKGENLTFINALFMSTSSVCVTGLSVLNSVEANLTLFGQIVLLFLMMIGGLGFLTFSTFFFIMLGSKIGMANRFLMREAWNLDSIKGIIRFVKNIVLFALGIQIIGAVINFFIFLKYVSPLKAMWVGLFHSVSAFNNVGLDIFGSSSMIEFKSDVWLNLFTMFFIILGGIGFVTIFDLFKNKKWSKLNITTKIIIIMVPILILLGMVVIKLSMFGQITWLQSGFMSVSSRTAGFTTFDMSTISNGAYIVVLILMFIGGSPCSTAGGIKITSFVVLLITMFSFTTGKVPQIFQRKVSNQTILKSFTLFAFGIFLILLSTLLISFSDPNLNLKDVLFEVVSAFGTVGFSLGITTSLTAFSKMVIIITMFLGRIGPLTMMSVVNKYWANSDMNKIDYVEGKIIIG